MLLETTLTKYFFVHDVVFIASALPGALQEPPIIRLTEYGELSVGPDEFRQSPRSHLALILSVVVQRSILDANVVLALLLAAHDRVARKRRDCPFKSCNKEKRKTHKR